MTLHLEKGPSGIVFYPVVQGEVSQAEIWREVRSGVTTDKGLGLYVHIPFCKHICPFCPFIKVVWKEDKEKTYLDALRKEIALYAELPFVRENAITAIHFGGGTPTALTAGGLLRLVDDIRESFRLAPEVEFGLETHALTTDEGTLRQLMDRGVNRVTVGVQSFTARLLDILGCQHTAADAVRTVRMLRDLGIRSVGIDLFYRVPGQGLDDWKRDLEVAVACEADHLSCYNLGIYPGTALYESLRTGKVPPQPGPEAEVDMHRVAQAYLAECGYQEYTIANFARPGKRCLYLRQTLEAPQAEYLGLGVSAFEYANDYYSRKVSSIERYAEMLDQGTIPYLSGTQVVGRERMARYMVLGLGCLQIDKLDFSRRFGVELHDVYGEIVDDLEAQDLVAENATHLWLTEAGKDYAASISRLFFTDPGKGVVQGARVQ